MTPYRNVRDSADDLAWALFRILFQLSEKGTGEVTPGAYREGWDLIQLIGICEPIKQKNTFYVGGESSGQGAP
jgi:hypothetical protein